MKHLEITCPGHPEATLEGFLLTDELHWGQGLNRPAIVICPGGGYAYCCPREGEPVAMAFASRGYHTFVLRYSVGRSAAGFSPLEEISWVIGLLRENAEKWHILPEAIAVCGFSAGGHLALASGVLGENKPNAMILGYPVVSTPNVPGMDFMLKLLTGKEAPDSADAARFDLPSQITKDAPPVFLFATAEDPLTAFGALPVAQAYSRLGMQYELHIFQFGPHGYSIATDAGADGSSRQISEAVSQWVPMCVMWLEKIFGKPQLEDKPVGKMMQYLQELGLLDT